MAKGSGVKTNEAPARAAKTGQRGPAGVGVRSTAKYIRTSPYKVRVVLDLIRGQSVVEAANILRFCERDAAITIAKVVRSAIANAGHNEDIPLEELYISACYCDEGPTIKRFRPRARGRTGRIFKRTSHITVIVSRMPSSLLDQARVATAQTAANRARRTAGTRATAEQAITESRRAETGIEEVVAGATIDPVVEATATVDAVVPADDAVPADVEAAIVDTPDTATSEVTTETSDAAAASPTADTENS